MKETVAGVEFEAVRIGGPRPYWKARCIETGYVFAAGVFNGESRAKLFASIRECARRIGYSRFKADSLSAT